MNQIKDNVEWLHQHLLPEQIVSDPVDGVTFHGMHFDSVEEAKAFADNANLMLQFSNLAYMPDGGVPPEGYVVDAIYEDAEYGAKMVVYVDEVNCKVVIAVEGTPPITTPEGRSALMDDDLRGIAFDGSPLSYNEEAKDFIQRTISSHSGYDIKATGHSRGASVATAISRDFNLDAYAFDNPGIHEEGDYSHVYSFQGSDNIVNTVGVFTAKPYHRGNVIELPKTDSTREIEGIADLGDVMGHSTNTIIASLGGVVGPAGDIGSRLHSHTADDLSSGVGHVSRNLWEKADQQDRAVVEAPKEQPLITCARL